METLHHNGSNQIQESTNWAYDSALKLGYMTTWSSNWGYARQDTWDYGDIIAPRGDFIHPILGLQREDGLDKKHSEHTSSNSNRSVH